MSLILFITGFFSLYMIRNLFNKNVLIGFFFAFLQIYIYVPFAARCFNSDLVDIVSHITISKDIILYEYLIFCYSQSLILYLLLKYFVVHRNIKIKRKSVFRPTYINRNLYVYNAIQLFVGLFLMYNLSKSYSYLNYYDQTIVKSNVLWVILMEYSFVFYLIDFWLYKKERRIQPLLYGLFIALPTFVTLFKIGNRGIAIPCLCGYIYMILTYRNFKISMKQVKTMFIAVLSVLVVIGFSQFVRTNRGMGSDSHEFSLSMISGFFDISVLLFQDYTVPGNSLMYCIDKNIIDPLFVCLSNIGNGFFFLGYPTIAADISDRINTGVVFGVGGFLPVEGFYLCGYLGVLVLPLIITFFFQFYFKSLYSPNDKQYNLFIGFLLCSFLCFNLARGQSYLLFKVLYMYVLPCCILYRMAFGNKKYN